MSSPRVTIVIPCYNHAEWVCLAIMSAVNQTYKNIKIIVVNDGSTDDSLKEILDLVKGHKKFDSDNEPTIHFGKVKDTPIMINTFSANQGPSFARNYGIQISKNDTDVFAFLDADDMYTEEKVEKSLEILLKNSKIGAVYSDFNYLNGNRVTHREYLEPFSYERLAIDNIVNMNSLIRSEAFQLCGLFDESLRVCEDYDIWLRIAKKYIIYHIPESLCLRRVGNHNSDQYIDKKTWYACHHKVKDKCLKST